MRSYRSGLGDMELMLEDKANLKKAGLDHPKLRIQKGSNIPTFGSTLRQRLKLRTIATTTAKAAYNSSRSSRGSPSVAKEFAVLFVDSGRNCTWKDSGRKLQGPSDSFADDRGRLSLLCMWQRQW
ncbi:hypothetical protein BHM03_00048455 [Ensete ventricosum]|nr:hypothetical protein BHM03_00048455 [Ensete ventricosum]